MSKIKIIHQNLIITLFIQSSFKCGFTQAFDTEKNIAIIAK